MAVCVSVCKMEENEQQEKTGSRVQCRDSCRAVPAGNEDEEAKAGSTDFCA